MGGGHNKNYVTTFKSSSWKVQFFFIDSNVDIGKRVINNLLIWNSNSYVYEWKKKSYWLFFYLCN